jgi:transketolase C-terminal domain/subunit
MRHIDDPSHAPSDFALLEGLCQLAVTGHADDWEFERLNNAVYERLFSSYAGEPPAFDRGKRRFSGP